VCVRERKIIKENDGERKIIKENDGEREREREIEQRQFECVDSEDALSVQVSFRKRAL